METTNDKAQAAAAFAANPAAWGAPAQTLTGAEAAAFGRSVLEAAGVDVAAVERSVGRPRVGGPGRKGERSPRVNAAITDAQYAELKRREAEGQNRSAIVREALDRYFAAS
jgi:hypothetical protein